MQVDAFAAAVDGSSAPGEGKSYGDAMRLSALEREELRVKQAIEKQREDGVGEDGHAIKAIEAPDATPRRKRWDVVEPERPTIKDSAMEDGTKSTRGGEWDDNNTLSRDDVVVPKKKRSRWDETPVGTTSSGVATVGETPKRSRWDQTPVGVVATPMLGMQQYGMTPMQGMDGMMMGSGNSEMDKRNRPLSDEELNQMLPTEGYEVVERPAGYAPIRTPARKLMETPMAAGGGGFIMVEDGMSAAAMGLSEDLPTDIEGVGELAFFKQEDAQYFAKVSRVESLSLCPVLTTSCSDSRRSRRVWPHRRGAQGAQDHATSPQGQEWDTSHAQDCAATAHGQGARVWRRTSLRQNPPPPHGAHS